MSGIAASIDAAMVSQEHALSTMPPRAYKARLDVLLAALVEMVDATGHGQHVSKEHLADLLRAHGCRLRPRKPPGPRARLEPQTVQQLAARQPPKMHGWEPDGLAVAMRRIPRNQRYRYGLDVY